MIRVLLLLAGVACKSEPKTPAVPPPATPATAAAPADAMVADDALPVPEEPAAPTTWVVRDFSAADEVTRAPLTMRVPSTALARVEKLTDDEPAAIHLQTRDARFIAVVELGGPFKPGDLAKEMAKFQKDSIRRANELVDGYVLVHQLADESYWVTTVHGRMRCETAHAQEGTVEELVAACRSATEVAGSRVPWPQSKQVPLTPVQLDVCARLYVVMSSCGFVFDGSASYEQFTKRGIPPVTLEQARAACTAQTRESRMWRAFGQPPVPLIPVEDVVLIEQARERGCEDVIDVYSDRTGNVVATGP